MDFEKIAQEAYKDEMEKLSGVTSEYIGGALSGVAAIPAAIAAAITKTKTDKQMVEQGKAGISNFIPGVGVYRGFKRMGHSDKKLKAEKK